MQSILVKDQVKKFVKETDIGFITVEVRYDDRCNNGHNTFSITGSCANSCGCIHDTISKYFPELAHLIKWHLCNSDRPMYYLANTLYHVLEHGPTHAWIYYTGQSDPLGIGGIEERLVGYVKSEIAKQAEGQSGYDVKWDEKTIKVRNLDHARSSAIWLEATDEELTAPNLEDKLKERLPALLDEFRAAVESLGFTY